MRELIHIIPFEAQVKLREFYEQGLNGQVTLNFNAGRIQSFECKDHRRIPAQSNGNGSHPVLAPKGKKFSAVQK